MSAMTVARVEVTRALRRSSSAGVWAVGLIPSAVGLVTALRGGSMLGTAAVLLVKLIAPLSAVALVASPVGEGYESRTVLYWFLRPVPRSRVVLGAFMGYASLVAVGLFLSGAVFALIHATAGHGAVSTLATIPLALAFEGAALTAMVLGLATLFPKWPVAASAGLLTLTEAVLPVMLGQAHLLSVSWHISHLMGLDLGTEDALLGTVPQVSAPVSVIAVLLFAALPVAAAVLNVEDRELQ
ncbi:MAG: ABC transporter permease [Myxococcales bacterium]|nr:ABC transporter permease [Myxococcales bacterium]